MRVNRRGEEELPEFRLKPQTKRGILVVLFFALAVLSLLSLFDSAGSLGRIFGQFLGLLLGTAGFLGPIIFFALAVGLLMNRQESKDGRDVPVSNLRVYLGALFFTLALTGILHLLAMRAVPDSAFELVKRGELESDLVDPPSPFYKSLAVYFGFSALAVGSFLAVFLIVAGLKILL